jgi:hypothetical protein
MCWMSTACALHLKVGFTLFLENACVNVSVISKQVWRGCILMMAA